MALRDEHFAPDRSSGRPVVGLRVAADGLGVHVIPANGADDMPVAVPIQQREPGRVVRHDAGNPVEECGGEAILVDHGAGGLGELVERREHARPLLQRLLLATKDQQITRIPTMAREVFDVTGAGDTVIATLATMMACGLSVRDAMPIANRAGGIVVGKFGTASVSYDVRCPVRGVHDFGTIVVHARDRFGIRAWERRYGVVEPARDVVADPASDAHQRRSSVPARRT